MYCPECKVEYQGWKSNCPVCQAVLLESKPTTVHPNGDPIRYDELVEIVRENGGSLTIELTATKIEKKRGRGFPYLGRGYAWAKEMEGAQEPLAARLSTTEVGRKRGYQFPYFGFGYAWEKAMQGEVSGNPVTLKAVKVARERKIAFPYQGYGRAWVQAMSGECGEALQADLKITEVKQRKEHGFPYFGFGYAWANAGELTLSLGRKP
jgi:hypothetical protein